MTSVEAHADGATGDWQSGSLVYRRGWLASTGAISHDVAADWPVTQAGPFALRVHPALGWASYDHAGSGAVILGDPVDLDATTTDRRAIARRAAISSDPLRYVAGLGGRFACLVYVGDVVTVIPDCVAAMPVYWHRGRDATVTLASHSNLVRETVNAGIDDSIAAFMRHAKTVGAPATLYWPGIETPYQGVVALLPNHVLRVNGGRVEHDRFYPFPETQLPSSVESAYAQFHDLFSTHVRLICGLGRIGISLTGGRDSRATLAAARPFLGPDALTWTYYKFQAPDRGMQADLLEANAIAWRANLPHRIVSVEESAGEFAVAYARTFRHTPQFRVLAEAYRAQLPHDIVEMQSMVAEIGTGFYKRRDAPFSIDRLTHLYGRGEFARSPAITAAIERFVEYGSFDPTRFGPIDYHDLFYWESRIGRWGTLRMQEVDLAHQIALPYNSRGIVEALQGPSLADRVDKQALSRFIGQD